MNLLADIFENLGQTAPTVGHEAKFSEIDMLVRLSLEGFWIG